MTQDEAFTLLTMGKNVFLTGAPGSGKTFLINKYVSWLRSKSIEPAITASTGIAATHIGGQTIHSWAGIGVKNTLSPYDLDQIGQNERLVKRFRKTRVLLIDEVSMLSGNTLRMIDMAIRAGLQTHEPFGGMQVILSGDFFQLPPVERTGDIFFSFQSASWGDLSPHTCYLEEQHRQKKTHLADILHAMRNTAITSEHKNHLNDRKIEIVPKDIPHLYTHNVDVDAKNTARLAQLKGKEYTFRMESSGSKKRVETLKKGVLAPEILTLKKNAQVMFVKNHSSGMFVNGTLGTVVGFSHGLPKVKTTGGKVITVEAESWGIEENGKVLAQVSQLPLRLAWAITIHKSQGMTLDAAYIDLTKTFVEGQGYVALSRVKDLSGLYLSGIREEAFRLHPRIVEADTVFRKQSEAVARRIERTPRKRIRELQTSFLQTCGD